MRVPGVVVAAVLLSPVWARAVPAAPQEGGSVSDALDAARRDAQNMRDLQPAQLVRYHFDVASAPSEPERAPAKTLGGRAGYTRATVTRTAGVAWEQKAVGRGLFAVYARSINVDYGLGQRVLVAGELPEGGCAYDATWRHELRHASDFTRLFTGSLPDLKASFDQAVAELRVPTEAAPAVVDEASAARLRAASSERLVAVLEAKAGELQARFEAARGGGDSPAQVKAVVAACPATEWLSASAGPLEGGAQPALLVP